MARVARILSGLVLSVLVAACAVPPAAAGSAPSPSPHAALIQVGSRTARVFDPGHARAILIALHGSGGSGEAFERTTGFDAEASRLRVLAVYPDGIGHVWNAGFCCPFGAPPANDDVAFLSSLIDRLAKPGWKVFVAGFSNGGMMAYRLACDVPAAVTAIAVVGADSEECAPKPPLPAIIHLQGTADELTGNRVWGRRDGRWVNTEPSATARWKRLGADVTLVTVPGGTHAWYRSEPDATKVAAAFFAARL